MKPFGLILAVGILQVLPLSSQNINIPDQCFINVLIEEGVDSNEDGLISYAEAEAVERLDFWSDCISDLKGIEAFPNLTHLRCGGWSVRKIDLSGNTKLTYLNIKGQFDTLDLSNNLLLDTLFCTGGEISILDVSKCVNLRRLNAWRNKIARLDLSHNPHLSNLDCGENLLTALDLSGCPELYDVDCSDNQIKHLDLSGITAIERLDCNDNQLSSLNLTNLDALYSLRCGDNLLRSLDLSNKPQLKYLKCSGNKLHYLDVSMNVKLRNLHCGRNPMTTLNISNNIALDTAGIGYGIADLAIDHMPSLEQVCVWELPFPPPGLIMDTIGSPNITFTTECVVGLQAEPEHRISIFPNPAQDIVKIQANWLARKVLTLCTTNGSHIQKTMFEGDTYHLDISGLPAGIYFITIHSPQHMAVGKLIKY